MTQPPAGGPPLPPPPSQPHAAAGGPPSPQRPSRWLPWIVVIAIFLLAGAVVLGLFLRAGNDGPLGSSADSSARAACELIGQVEPDAASDEQSVIELHRMGAAQQMAVLAAEQDEEYADFAVALREPLMVQQVQFELDAAEVLEALDKARDTCTDEFGRGALG